MPAHSTILARAVEFGYSETQEARFAGKTLGAKETGVSYHVVHPNKRQAFAHRHKKAEEIYVILSGGGRIKVDDTVIDVQPLDAIRVTPRAARAFVDGVCSEISGEEIVSIASACRPADTCDGRAATRRSTRGGSGAMKASARWS